MGDDGLGNDGILTMCQAFRAEESGMISSAAFAEARRMEMAGRMARQAGESSMGWTERFEPTPMRTVPWYRADWQYGPLVRSWEEGWRLEDRRMGAGGLPMDEAERATMGEDIEFLSWFLREMAQGGPTPFVRGDDLVRLFRLAGESDHARYAGQAWRVDRKDSLMETARTARGRLEATLTPESLDMIAQFRNRWEV